MDNPVLLGIQFWGFIFSLIKQEKRKIVRIHHFLLIFAIRSVNIVYNAVSVDHTSWQIVVTIKSSATRQSFFAYSYVRKGIIYGCKL